MLHGLARTDKSMNKLAGSLQAAGYKVINIGYPSTRKSIEELSEPTIAEAVAQCSAKTALHFVTHSMGGILVRHYLQNHSVANLKRVVMLGPPNQGSEVVDKLKHLWLFKLINGPAGCQLGTIGNSLPARLGPADYEVGVIAGNRSINPLLSLLLPKPNDGKVSVQNTRLAGMTDFIQLPVTHTFMMNQKIVIDQVIFFLHHGKFNQQLH